jgi:hypothetical protein
MRKRHKIRRNKHHNNRERRQTNTSMSPDKLEALEQLFKGMTPEEILAELNNTWIDARYKLVVVKQSEEELFKGWEVYHV